MIRLDIGLKKAERGRAKLTLFFSYCILARFFQQSTAEIDV